FPTLPSTYSPCRDRSERSITLVRKLPINSVHRFTFVREHMRLECLAQRMRFDRTFARICLRHAHEQHAAIVIDYDRAHLGRQSLFGVEAARGAIEHRI